MTSRCKSDTCVFAGPSLAGRPLPPGIDVLPPAARGAISAAVKSGYSRIGFIDGAVEGGERLPLRELREALATPGVSLFGAAGFGAVRAVQLRAEGMCGVGRVFRLFSRGLLANDDEVYELHAPAALRYRCLTMPLVNVRYTLRALRLARRLSRDEEQAIAAYMREVPWFDRDRRALSAALYAACGSSRCARLERAFESRYRDIKQEDARALVAALSRSRRLPDTPSSPPPRSGARRDADVRRREGYSSARCTQRAKAKSSRS